jgi:hypothetical protein
LKSCKSTPPSGTPFRIAKIVLLSSSFRIVARYFALWHTTHSPTLPHCGTSFRILPAPGLPVLQVNVAIDILRHIANTRVQSVNTRVQSACITHVHIKEEPRPRPLRACACVRARVNGVFAIQGAPFSRGRARVRHPSLIHLHIFKYCCFHLSFRLPFVVMSPSVTALRHPCASGDLV